jgi:hypothetical protein
MLEKQSAPYFAGDLGYHAVQAIPGVGPVLAAIFGLLVHGAHPGVANETGHVPSVLRRVKVTNPYIDCAHGF